MDDKIPLETPADAKEKEISTFAEKANQKIIDYLEGVQTRNEREVTKLRKKLTASYWISVTLTVIMFVVGLVLMSVPFLASFRGEIDTQSSLLSGGFGIANLTVLFLVGPIKRIHKYMGDIAQIILVINSFQNQVALRLLETNIEDRTTIGKAAEHINKAAEDSSILIQKYFEETSEISTE